MNSISLAQLSRIISLISQFWLIKPSPEKIELGFPVPRGLELVYQNFSSVWTMNGCPIFGQHNRLFSSNSIVKSDGLYEGMPCTPGHVVFAEENQAVWFASTQAENHEDQAVWLHIPGNIPSVVEYPSVNAFLAGIMLEESVNAAKNNCPCAFGWNDTLWSENNFVHALSERPHYGFGYTRFLVSKDGMVIIGGDENQPLTISSNP